MLLAQALRKISTMTMQETCDKELHDIRFAIVIPMDHEGVFYPAYCSWQFSNRFNFNRVTRKTYQRRMNWNKMKEEIIAECIKSLRNITRNSPTQNCALISRILDIKQYRNKNAEKSSHSLALRECILKEVALP